MTRSPLCNLRRTLLPGNLRRRRAGISLMEVLFSIGVIVVGLMGVAILIPAAAKSAQDGVVADRAARDGQNWVREFKVRGFAQTDNWLLGDDTPAYAPDTINRIQLRPHEQSFCIDPRFVAANAGLGRNIYFPHPLSATATHMRRITLRSSPSLSAPQMTAAQSDSVFISPDDLIFNAPKDATALASQVFAESTPGVKIARQYDGRLSWMATLVPRIDGPTVVRDYYTLSVIVFSGRDGSMTIASGATNIPDNERVVEVAQYLGGGDVQLRTQPSRPSADLILKRGSWLMLSAVSAVHDTDSNSSTPFPVFKWYRVLEVDEIQPASGRYIINVTLHGAEWDPSLTTTATLVSDVVAVFEKTIQIESPSLWTK